MIRPRDVDALLELAERCGEAAGPDRVLDAEIDIALSMFPEKAYQQRQAMRPRGTPAMDRLQWMVEDRFTRPLTNSIDDAITLVPEGWAWMAGCAPGEGFFATLSPTDESGIEAEMIDTYADTAALALCAAALRARSAQS